MDTIINDNTPYITHDTLRFYQHGPGKTCSTVLYNILIGLIDPYKNAQNLRNYDKTIIDFGHSYETLEERMNCDIDKGLEPIALVSVRYGTGHTNDFVNHGYDAKFKKNPNIIFFNFDDLNEKSNYGVSDIVEVVYNKIYDKVGDKIILNKKTAIERIQNMNKRYEIMKYLPYDTIDYFYGLHGSHKSYDQKANI